MPSDRVRDALDGILVNIDAIADFTSGITAEAFASDRRTLYAVTRALEIISEASRRLPDDLKARHADIPPRAIHDAGNVYRHTYSKVSPAAVWDTAVRQLGSLRMIVAQELGTAGSPPPASIDTDHDKGFDS